MCARIDAHKNNQNSQNQTDMHTYMYAYKACTRRFGRLVHAETTRILAQDNTPVAVHTFEYTHGASHGKVVQALDMLVDTA
jgi:hypothetical protein